MKLRCYCCGKPIKGQFAVVTNGDQATDRVFVMLPDHVKHCDNVTSLLVIPVILHRAQP